MRKPLTLETLESLDLGRYIILNKNNTVEDIISLMDSDSVGRWVNGLNWHGAETIEYYATYPDIKDRYILAIKDIDLSPYK